MKKEKQNFMVKRVLRIMLEICEPPHNYNSQRYLPYYLKKREDKNQEEGITHTGGKKTLEEHRKKNVILIWKW